MAILFDWYENPKTKDKQGEELTLHPRIKLNGSTTTDELRRHIQEYCSLTETDVLAVLDALSHFVGRELGEGRQVHLDGIGYFVPTLTCTEPVTLETKRKSTKVKLKNITFRPDKALRSEIGVLKVKPLKLRNLTKKRLTDDEVKQKVVNYLRKNEFITRSVVQSICGMTRTTATRQIRRLCEENVLVNKGLQKQPIYFWRKKSRLMRIGLAWIASCRQNLPACLHEVCLHGAICCKLVRYVISCKHVSKTCDKTTVVD